MKVKEEVLINLIKPDIICLDFIKT